MSGAVGAPGRALAAARACRRHQLGLYAVQRPRVSPSGSLGGAQRTAFSSCLEYGRTARPCATNTLFRRLLHASPEANQTLDVFAERRLGGRRRNLPAIAEVVITYPWPGFLAEDLARVAAAPLPFAPPLVHHIDEPRGATVEGLTSVAAATLFEATVSQFWELASAGRISEIPSYDLGVVIETIWRARDKPTPHPHRLLSAILHELLVVRGATVREQTLLFAGVVLADLGHGDLAVATVAAYWAQGGSMSRNWGSLAALAYLARSPPDTAMAESILRFVIDNADEPSPLTVASQVFQRLIQCLPPDGAKEWHATALHQRGFPRDPFSSGPSASEEYLPPLAVNRARLNLDVSLSSALARAGDAEACNALLARWAPFAGQIRGSAMFHLRGNPVIAHCARGDPDAAVSAYAEADATSEGTAHDAAEALADLLAARGRRAEAMGVFRARMAQVSAEHAARRARWGPAPMGRDVLVGRWTRAAYLFAARACHPDAEAVAGLLKELERLGVKPGWEAEAVLGSCLLLGEGELWGQMLAVSAAARLPLPRVLAGVAQSLALGHNIELIQRLWDEVLVRLIEEPDERARLGQEPEREMLAALTPPRGRDFADLLRAPPYADRPLAGSGLTGKDWSELVERARRELEEVVGAPAPTQEDIEWLEAGYTDPLV